MSKIITDESELNTSLDDLITEDYALEILGLKNVADFRKFSRSFMKLSKIVKGIENSDSEKLDKGSVSEEYNTAKKIEDKIKKINNEKLDKGLVSEEYDTAKKIEDKIKEAKKAGTDAGTEASKKLNKGNVQSKYDTAEKIGNEIDKINTSKMFMQGMVVEKGFDFNKKWGANRVYRISASEDTINPPQNAAWSTLLTLTGGGDTGVQLLFPYNSDEIYFRNSSFDVENPNVTKNWKRIWNDGNFNPSSKLEKGGLPAKISDAKGLYDLIESNSGLNFDTALLYLNDAGTKYVNKIYFDRNKKGLFKCISQTTSTTNSTSYFVDISNEANSAQLRNLGGIISSSLQENGYVKFSNGIVLQWGTGKTFPIAFPNKCLHVSATIGAVYGGANSNDDILVTSMSRTGFTTYRNYQTKFFAIGY